METLQLLELPDKIPHPLPRNLLGQIPALPGARILNPSRVVSGSKNCKVDFMYIRTFGSHGHICFAFQAALVSQGGTPLGMVQEMQEVTFFRTS